MNIFKGEPELADILGTFGKTVERLRTYSTRQREKVGTLKREIDARTIEVADSEANIAQADLAAERIASIIGAPATA